MKHVKIDPLKKSGSIKPQHGLCNFGRAIEVADGASDEAQCWRINEIFSEIDPPFNRIKYFYTGYGKTVDVPFIFRHFNRDENDPKNYIFDVTDAFLKEMLKSPRPVIYRLGALREWHGTVYNKRPENYEKWAAVCCNIIRHLNDGWANGMHLGIKYWEIWNRADDKLCWTGGSFEDYYRLYEVTARKIKEMHPRLKVGGPAAADCSGDNAFLKGFLKYVKENNVPCDFVSWNYYGLDPAEAGRQARMVKKLVREAGISKKTEVFCDEWNAITLNEKGWVEAEHARDVQGAAFDAAFMIEMQKAKMDASFFYDASSVSNAPWCSLFETGPMRINDPIYSFLAFARVYKKAAAVQAKTVGKNVYALAAEKDGRVAVLISVYEDKNDKLHISLPVGGKKKVTVIDKNTDFKTVLTTEDVNITIPYKGYTTILVESI